MSKAIIVSAYGSSEVLSHQERDISEPSANEISPEALAKVSEVEKKAKRLSLFELTERTCKWPVGDPATDDFWFCGLATQAGKPYCEAHVGVAFQRMTARRARRSRTRTAVGTAPGATSTRAPSRAPRRPAAAHPRDASPRIPPVLILEYRLLAAGLGQSRLV